MSDMRVVSAGNSLHLHVCIPSWFIVSFWVVWFSLVLNLSSFVLLITCVFSGCNCGFGLTSHL